jgi:hypothetical protein
MVTSKGFACCSGTDGGCSKPSPNGQRGIDAADPLEMRIGIATGLVVVGDLIGEGAAQEQAVVGETANLAAHCKRWPSRVPW